MKHDTETLNWTLKGPSGWLLKRTVKGALPWTSNESIKRNLKDTLHEHWIDR